ncbi:MAG TPA: POTRA domain-containing protein [Candidatus Sulfotelmatobacter sp.]
MRSVPFKALIAVGAEIAEHTDVLGSSSRPLALLLLWLSFASFNAVTSANGHGQVSAGTQDAAKILVAVRVKGTKRYKEDEVIAASGLQLGRPVVEDDFKKAARTLGDSGVFTDIAYSFSYSSAGTRLELQVTDAAKFLPAHFEDFVWFSDAELNKAIKNHVPLFNGELPAFGRMPDEVSNALQTLLVQNGIAGRVDYLRTPGKSGDIESFNYSVADVVIRVQKLELTGAGPSELSLLETAARKLPDHEYSRSRIESFIQHQLLPILHGRGFLKASFGPPQPKVVKQEAESGSEFGEDSHNRTFVDVILAVAPGQAYKLDRIEWSGNHAIPTEQLQAMIHVKIGEPANTNQVEENLTDVRTLYGSRGYVNSAINVVSQFNDAASTVVLRLEVKEDYVYHMGELEFRGLDNSLTAKLHEAWKIRPGEVYDATYLKEYLPQANKLLPASFDWDVVPHVTANVHDKTVDVDLQYSVKAPK